MYHQMKDHHGAMEASMFAPVTFDGCICGDPINGALHGKPPCDWCSDGNELGAPAPWWHRAWCWVCVWLFLGEPKKEK